MNLTRIISLCLSLCLLCSCAGANYSESALPTTEENVVSDEETQSFTEESAFSEETQTDFSDNLNIFLPYYCPDDLFYSYSNSLSPEECSPIDKSLDCEQILLDRAEALHRLMSRYLCIDMSKQAFDLGEPVATATGSSKFPITHGEFTTYYEFKALFSDLIYGDYFDKLSTGYNPAIIEEDGAMYFIESASGSGMDCIETWYLSTTVTNYNIIGHFVLLRGTYVYPEELNIPEYLNNVDNYEFYDITVQNVDGKYLLTDCYGSKGYDYYRSHGWLYNKHWADRSLITNPAVKPAFP